MANAPSTTPSDTHKKSKKDKQKENITEAGSSVQKEKKRKRKHHDEPEPPVKGAAPAEDDSERPKKKQNKDELDSTETNGTSTRKPPKRLKKPKDKAAKKLKEEPPNPKDKIQIVDVPIPYTNPLTDDSLSDLSQRGLAYAYQYAQHDSLPEHDRPIKKPWKFNKARQNWILRNVTDPVTIPDLYLGLALVYVDSIQGGARDALRKTCKATKKQAKAAKSKSKEQGKSAQTETKDEALSKKVTFAAETVSLDAPAAPSKERAKRAKTILKVLKGKIKPRDL